MDIYKLETYRAVGSSDLNEFLLDEIYSSRRFCSDTNQIYT